jgi:hypothetical protein
VIFGGGSDKKTAQRRFAVGEFPAVVKAFDANGDTFPDLLTVNQNSSAPGVSILYGSGSGAFGAAQNYRAGTFPNDIAAGDFNLDGLNDIAVSDSNYSSVLILHAKPGNRFHSPVSFGVGLAPAGLVSEDFNKDGKTDLATANLAARSISVLLNRCQ